MPQAYKQFLQNKTFVAIIPTYVLVFPIQFRQNVPLCLSSLNSSTFFWTPNTMLYKSYVVQPINTFTD